MLQYMQPYTAVSFIFLVSFQAQSSTTTSVSVATVVQPPPVWTRVVDPPQWGAADAEIKVPSGENTELKLSLFKAWSRSVYSHTCCTYCQRSLPCLFLLFRYIHLHFFRNLSRFLLCCPWLTHGSCVGLQNKIGHPARGRFPCLVPTEYK